MEPVPALVTLHLWRVERAGVPRGAAADGHATAPASAARRACASPSCSAPATAAPSPSATPTRTAGACSRPGPRRDAARDFERRSPVAAAWQRLAVETWRADLRPRRLAAAAGAAAQPFGDPVPERSDGPVAALTRARLRPRRAAGFWRAVPPVSADLRDRPGLRAAVGIGEAPLGLQGTFSLWESGAAAARVRPRRGATPRSSPAPSPSAGTPRSCSPASTSSAPPARSTAGTRSHDRRRSSTSTAAELRRPRATRSSTSTPRRWRCRAPTAAHAGASILAAHLERDGLRGGRRRVDDDGDARRHRLRLPRRARAVVARPGAGRPRRGRRAGAGSTARSRSASSTSARRTRAPGSAARCSPRCSPRTDAPTAVLTTPDARDPGPAASTATAGWVDLVRDLRFPGDPRAFAVLAPAALASSGVTGQGGRASAPGHNGLVAACYLARGRPRRRGGRARHRRRRRRVRRSSASPATGWTAARARTSWSATPGSWRTSTSTARRPGVPGPRPVGLRAVRRARASTSSSTSTAPAPRSSRSAAARTPTPTAPSSSTGRPATCASSRPSRARRR